jgi:nicotinamidase-related amidase
LVWLKLVKKGEIALAITTIDSKTALVLIDLQRGIVGMPTAHPAAEVVERAAELATAFRKLKLPVVLVNVKGVAPGRTETNLRIGAPPEGWDELAPELDAQPSDIKVTKHWWGAFTNTTLHEQLQALGVTQIVLAGIATSIGVESTARTAYELGYNVTLAVDAMTDRSIEAHENSVNRIFPRLGETGSTAEILAALQVSH